MFAQNNQLINKPAYTIIHSCVCSILDKLCTTNILRLFINIATCTHMPFTITKTIHIHVSLTHSFQCKHKYVDKKITKYAL